MKYKEVKYMVWNLIENWSEFVGAVKSSKIGRPTHKILEKYVFSDPITLKQTICYSTIRNLHEEMKAIIKKNVLLINDIRLKKDIAKFKDLSKELSKLKDSIENRINTKDLTSKADNSNSLTICE